MWPLIEQTALGWRYRGRPSAHRTGITADVHGGHRVWIDDPDYPLPDPPGHSAERAQQTVDPPSSATENK